MALQDGQNKIQYTVSTETSSFDFPYKYWDSEDLVVTVVNLSSGATTVLSESGGDYTVTPTNGDPRYGATIATTASYDNHRISIERVVPYASEANYATGDTIPPTALTEGFDKGAAMSQQLYDTIGRSITAPSSDPIGLNYELPSAEERASKAQGFDSAGNVVALDLSSTGTVSADTTKGISLVSNIISSKVDGATIGFNGSGQHEVIGIPDGSVSTDKIVDESVTLAKMADLGNYKVIGNVSGASDTPAEVTIIDDDTMGTATAQNIPTAESVKAYVDGVDSSRDFSPTSYSGEQSVTLPNGLIMKFGTKIGNGIVTFGTAFPTTAINAQVSVGPTGSGSGVECTIQALSTTSITLWNNLGIHPMYWQAIGY